MMALRCQVLLVKPRFVRLNFMHTIMKKPSFTPRLVAQNIEGKAISVVDHVDNDNLTEICAALDTAFGILDLNCEQLSENRVKAI